MIETDSSRWAEGMIWVALTAISMPILLDYGQHVASHSWAWYAPILLLLTVVAVLASPRQGSRPLAATILVAIGVGVQAWAVASGVLRLGRLGVVLCAAGVLLLHGRAHGRSLLLLALAIPVPNLVMARLGEPLLVGLSHAVAIWTRWTGTPALVSGHRVDSPGGSLYLDESDLGCSAAVFAFGLAWFVCARHAVPILRSFVLSSLAALLGTIAGGLVTILLYSSRASTQNVDSLRTLRDLCVIGLLLLAAVWYESVRSRSKLQLRPGEPVGLR